MTTTEPFRIERDVQQPAKAGRAKSKYPFGQMEIGDSFFVPGTIDATLRLRSAAVYWSIRHPGYKFTVRTVTDGCRVWRIEPDKLP